MHRSTGRRKKKSCSTAAMIPGVLIILKSKNRTLFYSLDLKLQNELKESSNLKKKYFFASPKKNLSFSTIFPVYIMEKKIKEAILILSA